MSRLDESAEQQIERLGQFILDNIPGEPSRSEGAVDVAIRLLARVDALTDALREWFAGARPVGWSEAEHVANPRVNRSQRDADLAEFVARRVLGEAS